jgi:uncharacterized membrane protein
MSENTGGTPPRQPDEPERPDTPEQPAPDPWRPPSGAPQPPSGQPEQPYGQPQQPPTYGQQPPTYGQYAPGGYPTPPPASPYGYDTGAQYGGPVSVGRAFSWAWSSFGKSVGAWIGAGIIVFLLSVTVGLIFTPDVRAAVTNFNDPEELTNIMERGLSFGQVLLSAIGTVILFVIGSVAAHGAIAATHRGRAAFADFWALKNVPGIIMLAIVRGAIDLVLAFIPVIGFVVSLVVAFFLALSLFFVIDKGQDALTAMRSSVQTVSQNLGVSLLTLLAVIAILIVGALLFGIGLIVAVPVAYLTGAFVYRRLINEQPATP